MALRITMAASSGAPVNFGSESYVPDGFVFSPCLRTGVSISQNVNPAHTPSQTGDCASTTTIQHSQMDEKAEAWSVDSGSPNVTVHKSYPPGSCSKCRL